MDAEQRYYTPLMNSSFVPLTPAKTLHPTHNSTTTATTTTTESVSGRDQGTTPSVSVNVTRPFDLNSTPTTTETSTSSEREFSQGWGFGNICFNGGAPSSWTPAATTSLWFGEQARPQCSAGYEANATAAAIGSYNTPQSQPQSQSQPVAIHDIVDCYGATTDHQTDKKQHVRSKSKKNPGEKRQNKYYWAKIDVPKPVTPKSKTPKTLKPKAPKSSQPKTPKTPKSSQPKAPKAPKAPKSSQPKASKARKTLNFEDEMKNGLEMGFSSGINVPENVDATRGGSEVGFRLGDNVVEKDVDVMKAGFNSLDSIVLVKDVEHAVSYSGDLVDVVVKSETKRKAKKLMVYQRRFDGKCLRTCRGLRPSLAEIAKKKRLQRNKKSFESLKIFRGYFNDISLKDKWRYRILSARGKLQMLLPTEVDISHRWFSCVLSLLSSDVIVRRKRRSRLLKPISHSSDERDGVNVSIWQQGFHSNVDLFEHGVNDGPFSQNSFSELVNSTPSALECSEREIVAEQLSQISCSEVATSTHSTVTDIVVSEKSSKAGNAAKKKTSNRKKAKDDGYLPKKKTTNKRKLKDDECIPKLSDAEIEEMVDKFTEQLWSLKIEDDPKTWSIVVQDNRFDGIDEKIRLGEERAILFKKIERFMREMNYYQGNKKFIKWNGSMLDSVVGVFLTQNVSDVLSSNAFMRLVSSYPIAQEETDNTDDTEVDFHEFSEYMSSQGSSETGTSSPRFTVNHPDEIDDEEYVTPSPPPNTDQNDKAEYDDALKEMIASLPDLKELSKSKGKNGNGKNIVDWEKIRVKFLHKSERTPETQDSVDWEAVVAATDEEIAIAIRERGQHNIMAIKIKKMLKRLINDHGTLDMEWLRVAPPPIAKAYLLSFYGIGLKSVECLRLLTLRHHGFPVDVNIARTVIRLNMVPIKELPPGLPFHLLAKYPIENEIQKYLWPRLCHLDQETLYRIHYQMITFGKVFCLKRSPNCGACPFKSGCKYFESLMESRKLALEWKKSKKSKKYTNPFDPFHRWPASNLPYLTSNITSTSRQVCISTLNNRGPVWKLTPISHVQQKHQSSTIANDAASQKLEYYVEEPSSPEPEEERNVRDGTEEARPSLVDIEDCCDEYMYHLKLNSSSTNVGTWPELIGEDTKNPVSTAMVGLSPSASYKPLPKQIQTSRLRTEHQVYEIPRDHPLLKVLKLHRQIEDVPYLLAIWTTGQSKKSADSSDGNPGSSSETGHDDSSTVPGTILIPISTALRRSFPLNATYFQMNEVFADYETSQRPVNVPRSWIWNLKKRTLYCGTSTTSIVKGWGEFDIRQMCWEGYICVRGFNRRTRGPTPLSIRFHERPQGKKKDDVEPNEP